MRAVNVEELWRVVCGEQASPLGQRGEVGEDVSRHHVQAGLRQLQMDGLERVVRLHHCVLISRAQAAGGAGRLHPAQDRVRGHTQAPGYSRYRTGHGVKECTTQPPQTGTSQVRDLS